MMECENDARRLLLNADKVAPPRIAITVAGSSYAGTNPPTTISGDERSERESDAC